MPAEIRALTHPCAGWVVFDPNRFNGLYGAAQVAELAGKQEKATQYYAELVKVCEGSSSDRPELSRAKGLVAQR
jgi:hypothetical protein